MTKSREARELAATFGTGDPAHKMLHDLADEIEELRSQALIDGIAYSMRVSERDKARSNYEAREEEAHQLSELIIKLRAELAENEALREKMGGILTRSVNAIRGEPDTLSLHSWHDLPELIKEVTKQNHPGLRETMEAAGIKWRDQFEPKEPVSPMTNAEYQFMTENGKAWKFVDAQTLRDGGPPNQIADTAILALAHRMAWRYKHTTLSSGIEYTFNNMTLLDFVRVVREAKP